MRRTCRKQRCPQAEQSKGTFTWDRENGASGKGSARAANVHEGCFIQDYQVKPGEVYGVKALRRIQGRGDARIRIRWQTSNGGWTLEQYDRIIVCGGPRGEWKEMSDVVEIPEGVGKMVLLLGTSDQRSPQDIGWYDDVCVYKLE